MKNIQRLSSIGLTLLLAILMIFSPLTVLADGSTEQEAKDYTALVQAAIDGASANMISEGVNSEWQAIGLAKAGKEIPAEYIDTFKENIESQIANGLNSGRIKITDIERLAMAAVAIGKNPLDVEGHNLIELIYNSPDRMGDSDTMIFQGNNGPIFALIALDTDSFEVPEDARWTKAKLVQYLLEQQNADGSWSLFGTSPSFDITAMAIIALGNYKQDVTVLESIQKAASFLSASQSIDAGFNDPWNGGVSLETAAQVMIGLTTAGIDPLGPEFTKENGNLLDHILSFLADDGGFKHLLGDSRSNAMATEQGFQALVAYQLYENGEGRLYDFSKKDILPEPEEPEVPEVPEEPEISVDTVAPVITVHGITDEKTYSTANITFTVTATDDVDGKVAPVVKVNDTTLLPNKNHSYTAQLHKGVNAITITAVDQAGNQVDKSFVVDYQPTGEVNDDMSKDENPSVIIVDKNKDEGSHTSIVNTDKDKETVENSKNNGNLLIGKETNRLPNTATNTFNFLLIGFALVLVGGVIFCIRKKNVNIQ